MDEDIASVVACLPSMYEARLGLQHNLQKRILYVIFLKIENCPRTTVHSFSTPLPHTPPPIKTVLNAGEMAQHLKVLVALVEDPGSAVSTHMAADNPP